MISRSTEEISLFVIQSSINVRKGEFIHFHKRVNSRERERDIFDPRLRYAANQFHSASIPGNEKDRMVVILNSRLHRDQRIGKFVGSVGGVGSRRRGEGMSISGGMKSVERESAPEINFSFHKK